MTDSTSSKIDSILKMLRAGIWEEASGQAQFQDTITVDEAKKQLKALLLEERIDELQKTFDNSFKSGIYQLYCEDRISQLKQELEGIK